MSCNGCTDCCKVPTIFQKNAPTEHFEAQGITTWRRITKRQAKKRNPYLVNLVDSHKIDATYFRCTALVDGGCSIQNTKPQVCKGYPIYEKPMEAFREQYASNETEYSENCTLISAILLDTEEEYEERAEGFR